MKKNIKNKISKEPFLLEDNSLLQTTYTTDLRDRQSVRTTFNMSEKANDALNWLAKNYHITFKEVIDSLCLELSSEPKENHFLDIVAEVAKKIDSKSLGKSTRKTQVISKKSLCILKDLSKKHSIQRDLLIELSILLFKAQIEENIEKKREKHKEAGNRFSKFLAKAEAFEKELKKLLGDDDPIIMRFGIAMQIIYNLSYAIEDELKDGTPIDPDEW